MAELNSQPSVESAPQLTVESAIANLKNPDLSLRYYAAWWLGKFQIQDPAAVSALILALEDAEDRTELGGYPLRRNAARALGKIGDRQAVPGLMVCLGCEDYYVRETAAQSLGMLKDPQAIPPLLELLAGGVEAAVPVPGTPHLAQPYDAVIEALGDLQAKAATEAIRPFLNHGVPRVQYAAARAMYQLTQEAQFGDRLIAALTGPNVQLRRMALADLGATGYLPAATAIAKAPVENSFKLIALKGLLEHQLDPENGDTLNPAAIGILSQMDELL